MGTKNNIEISDTSDKLMSTYRCKLTETNKNCASFLEKGNVIRRSSYPTQLRSFYCTNTKYQALDVSMCQYIRYKSNELFFKIISPLKNDIAPGMIVYVASLFEYIQKFFFADTALKRNKKRVRREYRAIGIQS